MRDITAMLTTEQGLGDATNFGVHSDRFYTPQCYGLGMQPSGASKPLAQYV